MEEIDRSVAAKKIHKQQILWQIWVPLIVCFLIVLFLAVMSVWMTAQDITGDFNTKWSSISLVFLSLPALFAALVLLIVLCGLIYLAAILITKTPVYSRKVLDFLLQAQKFVQCWSDKIAEPVIGIKSRWHGLSRIIRK